MGNELEKRYLEKLNTEILSRVDFDKLDSSCNSENVAYAAGILKELHEAFVSVYGTDTPETTLGFVSAPAVLRGKSGRMAVGLVSLDLESAGEHYGSYFFTRFGVIDDGARDNGPQAAAYLKFLFQPYDYWYTVTIERDHHVDFDNVPEAVADILNRALAQPGQGMALK